MRVNECVFKEREDRGERREERIKGLRCEYNYKVKKKAQKRKTKKIAKIEQNQKQLKHVRLVFDLL